MSSNSQSSMFSSLYGYFFSSGSERSPSDRTSEAGNDDVVIDLASVRSPSFSGSHTSENPAADFSARIRRLISTLEEASKQGGEQYAQRRAERERQHGYGTPGSGANPGQPGERGIPRIPLGQFATQLRSAEAAVLNDSARIGSPDRAEIVYRRRLPLIDDANPLKIETPSSSELSEDGQTWHGEGMVVTFKVRICGMLSFTWPESLT